MEERGDTRVQEDTGGLEGEGLCLPLPMPSRISISSQAEAKETLVWGESEALSLIESHARVTCKALQSRKDLGATEPQTPAPSPVPRGDLASLLHLLPVSSVWEGARTQKPLLIAHTSYPMGWKIWEYVNGVSTILRCSSWGVLPSLVISLTGAARCPANQGGLLHPQLP